MFNLIKWEIKKNLRPGVFIIWALGLALGFKGIFTNFGVHEAYSALFSKYYMLTVPFMGLAMFTMFSGSFVREYNSNLDGLIKSSENGKDNLVLAKFIANGISASIINLSIFLVMLGRIMATYKFEGLDLPLKSLWYFGNSGSNLTILQMLLIISLTVILGSFVFAAIGLYLSSISKRATMPFILGGLTMGIPYFIAFSFKKEVIFSLLVNGMYSQQIVRYGLPVSYLIGFIAIALILIVGLYNLTKKRFLKEI